MEHHPLVTWQSLGQSEAFPPFRVGWLQPIRDFPTTEPGMLQHHNTKMYKKRSHAPQGPILKVHS